MGHATHRERYGSLLNVSLPPQLGSVSRAKGRERGSERNEMDGGGPAIPDDTRRLLGGNLRTPRTYLRFVDSSGYVVMMSMCRPRVALFTVLISVFGAGCQCRSSRVCPDFVLCPEFVLHLSSLCLEYVLVHWMSSLCLQNQTFVLPKSMFCPACPTYVLNLVSDADQIGKKMEDKTWTNVGSDKFTNLQSSHPATGQNLDKLWTPWNPQFDHLLSNNLLP